MAKPGLSMARHWFTMLPCPVQREAELSIAAWKQRFHSTEEERRKLHNELQEIRGEWCQHVFDVLHLVSEPSCFPGNIRVFCRIRPEPAHHKTVLHVGSKEEGEDTTLVFADPKTGRSQKFRVDRVFPSDTTQSTCSGSHCSSFPRFMTRPAHACTSLRVSRCVLRRTECSGRPQRLHLCIRPGKPDGCTLHCHSRHAQHAIPQTGSGKTHTMLGPPGMYGTPRSTGSGSATA